jgi:hypothetical protein
MPCVDDNSFPDKMSSLILPMCMKMPSILREVQEITDENEIIVTQHEAVFQLFSHPDNLL